MIGPDVMWWATCITRKDPGEIHGWHYDAEFTTHRDGVLVFLGLDNLTPQSALKVITHTHRLRKNPIAYTSDVWRGKEGSPIVGDDARVVEIARTQDERAELVSPDMNTGDFFFAHAHAWHGSKNVSPLKRMSAVLCFGPPDVEVRIPMSFDDEPISSTRSSRPARCSPARRERRPESDRRSPGVAHVSGSYALGPAQIEAFERLRLPPPLRPPVLEPATACASRRRSARSSRRRRCRRGPTSTARA